MREADETTALLGDAGGAPGAEEAAARNGSNGSGTAANGAPNKRAGTGLISRLRRALNVEQRILFAGFLITLSFSFTQVPIFYAFYLMRCKYYYTMYPDLDPGDVPGRCKVSDITAGTATDFSILAMSTTFFGTINLFVAGWMVKKYGPRAALMVQTFVPAIRVLVQILGVLADGKAGIIIFQCTQIITIIGGPAGYILVINIIAGEVVEPARRTALFGMLQGCFMFGQGVGYLTGGIIGDLWGISRPFEVAFCAFMVSIVYVRLMMPYISAESMAGDGKRPQVKGVKAFFAPLKVLAPQKVRLAQNGRVVKHRGVLFLCSGVFLGVLATDYVVILIQQFATAVFEFQQADNGWMMSEFAFMRGAFLILIFPHVISAGRGWYQSRIKYSRPSSLRDGQLPEDNVVVDPEPLTRPEGLEAPMGSLAEAEPPSIPLARVSTRESREGTRFDLFFLRWSLVVDGVMTMFMTFVTQRWQIYLGAALLPFASGTAPAAKGVMTEMCPPHQRADALNALTLVENIGRLATQGLFGFVFAAMAYIGKPHLTFLCNGAIAFLAVAVLTFSSFPPSGSTLVEDDGGVDENGEP